MIQAGKSAGAAVHRDGTAVEVSTVADRVPATCDLRRTNQQIGARIKSSNTSVVSRLNSKNQASGPNLSAAARRIRSISVGIARKSPTASARICAARKAHSRRCDLAVSKACVVDTQSLLRSIVEVDSGERSAVADQRAGSFPSFF